MIETPRQEERTGVGFGATGVEFGVTGTQDHQGVGEQCREVKV